MIIQLNKLCNLFIYFVQSISLSMNSLVKTSNRRPMVELTRHILILLLLVTFPFLWVAAGETKDLNVVQASEIISKVEKGEPVDYSYVLVNGDLNLKGLNRSKPRHIYFPIKITDSKINGSIHLNNTISIGLVDFKGTMFMGDAIFDGTFFEEGANFDNSRFVAYASFTNSQFNKTGHFSYTRFDESSSFLGTRFNGDFDFHNSRSNGPTIFESVVFDDYADFEVATFIGPARFEGSQFNRANFLGTQFKGVVDFDSAQFNDTADFSGTKFEKELYFYRVKFAKLFIIWDSIKDKLVCDGPTYLSLIKNFKEMEQFDDADNCYYQYRDLKRKERPLDWSKIFDYISWLSCGYGVRWQHTILSAAAIAILFGLYYQSYCLIRRANFLHKKEIKDPCENDSIQNFKKFMSFSVMLLLSLPPEWSRSGRDDFAKFVTRHWFSSILERLIGWGLILLLIGTLTRLMVRY